MIIGVRHAQVEASMAGKCYGSSDVRTELSHRQAAQAALASLQALGKEASSFDAVWTSDLSRCRGLADALVSQLPGSLDAAVDARLRELDHGSFEGRAWDEIHGSEPAALERWGAVWQTEGPPGGESAEMLEDRVRDWLGDLDETKSYLLVGHAGVMRAILMLRQGLDWQGAMELKISHLEAQRLA